jgi:hypothetical protein
LRALGQIQETTETMIELVYHLRFIQGQVGLFVSDESISSEAITVGFQVRLTAEQARIGCHIEHPKEFDLPRIGTSSIIHENRKSCIYSPTKVRICAGPEDRACLCIWIEAIKVRRFKLENPTAVREFGEIEDAKAESRQFGRRYPGTADGEQTEGLTPFGTPEEVSHLLETEQAYDAGR